MAKRKSTNEVRQGYSRGKRLGLKVWETNDTVFIEGSSRALRFLSDLFLAQSNPKENCGLDISPRGAGSTFFDSSFDPASAKGLYIHRLS